MELVRLAVIAYGKAKLIPGYVRVLSNEWINDGQDWVEASTSSDQRIHVDVYRSKMQVDQARRELPELEKQKHYNDNQVSKINKEIAEGRMGRKNDLSKFEAESNRIASEIRVKQEIIDSSELISYVFDLEDCV